MIEIEENLEILTRDGVLLRADLYRRTGQGPLPVILFRTPYDKTALNMDVLTPMQAVRGGYACVVQDTRGRFASGGDWSPMAWEAEGPDTFDTVEWIAKQDWCNGNVGMAGASYLGIVQWLGAMEQPPHLKAIAPTMSTSAEFDSHDTGGCFRLDHVFSWLAFMAADWLKRRVALGDIPDADTIAKIRTMATNPRLVMDELPLRENPWFDLDKFPLSVSELLQKSVEQTPTFDFSRIQIPTLSVGGFFDVFPRATIKQFDAVVEQGADNVANEHRLIIGPWLHAGTLPHYQGEMNFGLLAAASYSQLPQKHLQFFDRHLKGSAAPLPRIEYFLAGLNQWLTTETWPPESQLQSLHLRSNGDAGYTGGRLTRELPVDDEPADVYRADPSHPVPTHGGRVLYLGGLAPGPLSQAHLEPRDDVLVYTGEALQEQLVVAGNVFLKMHAMTSATDCDWIVKLLDVLPDSRAILVAEGALRARFRLGYDSEKLLTPDQLLEYEVDLGPVAWAFERGHQLRLHIQSSNFPHLDRNMQTGNELGVDSGGVIAMQTIVHTFSTPSVLHLPILKR